MSKRSGQLLVFVILVTAFAVLSAQTRPGNVHAAPTAVSDIVIVPRNYIFTWGSSGQNIDYGNTVYCSTNSDFWQVLYWRTSDTNSSAGINDWNPNVVVAGDYDIYVYVPNYTHSASITTQAKYYFNGGLLAQIDQNQNKCQWVYLGRRWFNAGTGDTVSMPAQTSDNPYRLIAGDGLKLVYVNPVPGISGLSPSNVVVSGSAFTLVVAGSNFVDSAVVRWNGSDRATTFVSSGQLQANISAADIAAVGTASITVFNPVPGGGTSGALTFTINNPTPAVSSLSPSSTTKGGGSFTLVVNGSNFVNGAVVRWNGSNRTTTFVNGSQIQAAIPAADIATAGTASVTVINPSPGGGTSGALTFSINNPTPSLSTLSPSSATKGGASFTLVANGSNFVNGAVVRWNGSNRTTTFVSSTQVQATISAADIATAGTASVTVINPTPGGGASNAATFTINNPSPSLIGLNPTVATVGGANFTLTANGSNFVNGAVVRWNGSNRTTTFVSSTQVQATISAADLAMAGTASVTIFNPAPGGGVSNAMLFAVSNPIPSLSAVNPTLITVNSPSVTLSLTGTNFVSGAVIRWNGSSRAATFLGSTTLRAVIPASDLSVTGTARVAVFNPGPGGGQSNELTVLVDGDGYEPDDQCTQSHALPTNGTAQVRTFHQPADGDWAHFAAISGTTYIIQATSLNVNTDLTLELYDACAGTLLSSDANAFGSDAQVYFQAPTTGAYYLKAINNPSTVYGSDVRYELSVRVQAPEAAVLIVAGNRDDYDLQSNILYAANLAYRTFSESGIPKERIRYLSAVYSDTLTDGDGDGFSDVFATSTVTNVREAITGWAAGLATAQVPLYVYLVDHGGRDAFLSNGSDNVIMADQLNGWLNTLEAATGTSVSVIYEACYSGSFIEGVKTLSKSGRVIVTSTNHNSNAYALPGRGAHFSDAFLSALGQRENLYTSYQKGVLAVQIAGLQQQPWLDDNGDRVANSLDGAESRARGLGGHFGFNERPPQIDWLQVDVTTGPTGQIRVQARDDIYVDTVRVEIYPPDFIEPAPQPDGTTPVLNIPTIELSRTLAYAPTSTDLFEASYSGFAQPGWYRLVAYAQDGEGDQGVPFAIKVCVNCSYVYLPLVRK